MGGTVERGRAVVISRSADPKIDPSADDSARGAA
jgi:hypothetical protein